MCRDLRTSIYLDDNASINSVPVENRPAHKYLCGYFRDVSDLFQKRRLRMSKVICDSHRWGFVPNNFGLFRSRCYFWGIMQHKFKKSSLEKKVSLLQYTKIYKTTILKEMKPMHHVYF